MLHNYVCMCRKMEKYRNIVLDKSILRVCEHKALLSGVEYISVFIRSNSLFLLPGQTSNAVEEISEISEWALYWYMCLISWHVFRKYNEAVTESRMFMA